MSQLRTKDHQAGAYDIADLSVALREELVATFGRQARLFLVARDGRCYVLTTDVDDADPPSEWTYTAYEVAEVRRGMARGEVASRQRVAVTDAVRQVKEDHGTDIPDDRAHDLILEALDDLMADTLRSILQALDIGDGGDDDGDAPPRRATTKAAPSTAELVAEAWPDDSWEGTAADVVALLRASGWEVTVDAVKRVLQRGDYAVTEVPGKASVWRRQRATKRGPKRA